MGYLLAIIPPFLDTVINYIDKLLLSKYKIQSLSLTIYSSFIACLTGIIIALFVGIHTPSLLTAFIITVSGYLSVFILLTYFKALTLDETSRVASLFQMVPVIVIIVSIVIFQEKFTIRQVLGSLLIITSSFLFTIKKFDKRSFTINQAFWYMVLASFLSATVYLLYSWGARETGYWQSIPFEGLGNGLGMLTLLLYPKNVIIVQKQIKKMTKKIFITLTISEIIYRISQLSLYIALILISPAIVSVLQGLQTLFLVIIGIVLTFWYPKLIKEIISKKTIVLKITLSLCILIGLVFIFI